ncbi:MAG: hypothetical protein IPG86_18055 [Chitinophagaceae bacterium]|nr:hypothetical protein [Chitinophagaceae bacterium]
MCLQAPRAQEPKLDFDFFGEKIQLPALSVIGTAENNLISPGAITDFVNHLNLQDHGALIKSLLELKEKYQLDNWLYYQLIRKTAGTISPKSANYARYTLYKWFLLTRSGFDATIKISDEKILFYIRTDDQVYNIPAYYKDGRQYVCLNYHDYGNHIDFNTEAFSEMNLPLPDNRQAFSYRITKLPEFKTAVYEEKDIQFNYYQNDYHFTIKLNPAVKTIFANYPVLDYASYFNIPLSQETYRSLIPLLKKNTSGMSVKGGVDYLMRFTRYAFMFKPDAENFGAEKRLSPEQTLLYGESDCEDRAALFFFLVREIYNLPMIVLAYPQHVTIAIKFEKPIGKSILYNGEKYSVCDPTPQKEDLALGQLLPSLAKTGFEVVYAYQPNR